MFKKIHILFFCLFYILTNNIISANESEIFSKRQIYQQLKDYPIGSNAIVSPHTHKPREISVGIGYSYIDYNKNDLNEFSQLTVLTSIGLTYRTDISVSLPFTKAKVEEIKYGLGDILVNIKTRMNNKYLNAAYIIGLNIPAGEKEIYGENNCYDISLDIPFSLSLLVIDLNFNIGGMMTNFNKNYREFSYNAGIGMSKFLSDNTAVSLETVYNKLEDTSDITGYFGMKFFPNEETGIDFLFGKQINQDEIGLIFSSGISFYF